MKRLGLAWLLTVLFSLSTALAHAVAVNLDAFTEGQDFVVLMNGLQGQPITGASLAFSLLGSTGEISSGVLKPVADGEYRVVLPSIASGSYTLKLVDTTFPQEALEVAKTVVFPMLEPVRFLLPASSIGQPDTTLLVVLAVLPVLIAVIALVLVLFLRPKNKEVPL